MPVVVVGRLTQQRVDGVSQEQQEFSWQTASFVRPSAEHSLGSCGERTSSSSSSEALTSVLRSPREAEAGSDQFTRLASFATACTLSRRTPEPAEASRPESGALASRAWSAAA